MPVGLPSFVYQNTNQTLLQFFSKNPGIKILHFELTSSPKMHLTLQSKTFLADPIMKLGVMSDNVSRYKILCLNRVNLFSETINLWATIIGCLDDK